MYVQVLCASCGVPLQFALPNHPAYIVCYNCNAKMVIQVLQLEIGLRAATCTVCFAHYLLAAIDSLYHLMAIDSASGLQPMAEQPDSQNPAIAPSEVVGQDATASTLMENPDQVRL